MRTSYVALALLALAVVACAEDDETAVAVDAVSADASGLGEVSGPGDAQGPGVGDANTADSLADAAQPLQDTGPGDTGESLDDTRDAPPDADPAGDALASDTSPDALTGGEDAGAQDVGVQDVGGQDVGPQTIAEKCFPGVNGAVTVGPAYDALQPVIGSHCKGTNHQDITGVQRVVFLGDSVTVGTPNDEHLIPTENTHYYRNQLAEWLATHFNLDKGSLIDWGLWMSWDYVGFSGKGMKQTSGAFSNCSKYGARTDDLMAQIGECFPGGVEQQKTLVVFTMGGNDVAALTKSGGDATPEEAAAGYPDAWMLTKRTVQYLEEAMVWLKDPAHFPNGVYVVFANPFEFTDGSGVTSACKPAQIQIPLLGSFDLSQIDINMAEVAGFKEWANKGAQQEMVVWMLEEYMRIATQYQVDLMLMLENFCGHGFVATGANADSNNACYKGPDTALWFDITCFHPSEAGHTAIADMFRAVIEE